jgi:hypothetical protein
VHQSVITHAPTSRPSAYPSQKDIITEHCNKDIYTEDSCDAGLRVGADAVPFNGKVSQCVIYSGGHLSENSP